MLEGDYVWMKPLPAPRADSDSPSWAFPFSYITPQAAHLQPVMRLMFPESAGDLSKVPNSGPAPVLMREQEWRKVGSLPAVQIVFETRHLPLNIPFLCWSQTEQSSKLCLFSLQIRQTDRILCQRPHSAWSAHESSHWLAYKAGGARLGAPDCPH